MFSITTFGESHGAALGVIVDGVPSNLDFDLKELQARLDKRRPGRLKGATARDESDTAEVLSGVFEGKTLGSPIAVIVKNTNQRSKDYDKLKESYRPGHADKTYIHKYGIRDHRGGGRSSGRETLARVIGGYFASLILKEVKVKAYISKLGPFDFRDKAYSISSLKIGDYCLPEVSDDKVQEYLLSLKEQGDSVGGEVCVLIENCPTGLGEPAFDKIKADFAKALLSIGACVGFSFGLGHKMLDMLGSEVSQNTSNFGGMEGGITNGDTIVLRAAFKPTSTIGEKAKEGRHDPCIVPRAVPVVEAMVSIVLADHFLRQEAYKGFISS